MMDIHSSEPALKSHMMGSKIKDIDDDPNELFKGANYTNTGEDFKHYHGPGSTPDCLDSDVITKLYQYIVPITFIVIIVLGVVGNLLVIYVILSRRKLQTVTNLLLLNLAVSDVSFLLICGSFSVVHYVMTAWPLGDALCRLTQYLLYVTCYVTVYTLIAVSAVRYLIVVYGPSSAFVRSKRNIVILIITIWVVFMVAKIPILVVHGVSFNVHSHRTECIIVGISDAQKLFASFFTFAYALPLLFICTLYLLILKHIRDNKNIRVNGTLPYSNERKRHVTKVVIIVVVTFAVCWLPLHLHLLVAYYGKIPENIPYKILLIFWQALSFMNSMLNPIIYNYVAKDFRDAFKDIICCCKKNESNSSRQMTDYNLSTRNNGSCHIVMKVNNNVAHVNCVNDQMISLCHNDGDHDFDDDDVDETTPAQV